MYVLKAGSDILSTAARDTGKVLLCVQVLIVVAYDSKKIAVYKYGCIVLLQWGEHVCLGGFFFFS